jgi:hypothetical protein
MVVKSAELIVGFDPHHQRGHDGGNGVIAAQALIKRFL